MQTVLIVDDEPAIVKLLSYNLTQANFNVLTANDGQQALVLVDNEPIDIVLLDLMLPKISGEEVLKQIRQRGNNVPVIVITAKTAEFDRVFGLEMGADDYITKPFSPREVVARIKAVLRRLNSEPNDLLSEDTSNNLLVGGPIKLNLTTITATIRGKLVALTPKEFKLLTFLLKNANQVFSREQLLKQIWGTDFVGDSRMVDMQIAHLREKIELDVKHPQLIKTVRGFGYLLNTGEFNE
ncbi:response regulator transcription factor [Lentilactobacillus kribbianus]|uniref:response regulator transcription factor n=1 Tax=Lentilactobacillus kribbianus TaxID=2729622 RepID=UPI001554B0CD|nr:response regulator transcription factor [Lentilactobacillus kribbianus]